MSKSPTLETRIILNRELNNTKRVLKWDLRFEAFDFETVNLNPKILQDLKCEKMCVLLSSYIKSSRNETISSVSKNNLSKCIVNFNNTHLF